jgi:putative membrane protein
MSNKHFKLTVILTILFEFIVLITGIIGIFKNPKKIILLSLLAMVCLMLPRIVTYIANKRNMCLPPNFELFFLIFIFCAQYLGEIVGFYEKFWWWDTMLHFVSGLYLTVIGSFLINDVFISKNETMLKRFILFSSFFSFCFTVTMGVLWEIFEFAGDYLLKTHMVEGSYEDSAVDLLVKTVGALIVAVIYHQKNKRYNL